MRTLIILKSLVVATALTVTVIFSGSTASASTHCHTPRYYDKVVTVYETVQRPYEYVVTKYDHCGKPYHVTKVGWKTFNVPVVKHIRVPY